MKKRIALLLCMIMAATIALTACGGGGGGEDLSDSKYVGEWKALSMSMGDESEDFDDDITLTLNADGTAVFASDDEVTNCTWELTDEGFKLKGDAKMKFKDAGDGKVTSKILGAEMSFEKQ